MPSSWQPNITWTLWTLRTLQRNQGKTILFPNCDRKWKNNIPPYFIPHIFYSSKILQIFLYIENVLGICEIYRIRFFQIFPVFFRVYVFISSSHQLCRLKQIEDSNSLSLRYFYCSCCVCFAMFSIVVDFSVSFCYGWAKKNVKLYNFVLLFTKYCWYFDILRAIPFEFFW